MSNDKSRFKPDEIQPDEEFLSGVYPLMKMELFNLQGSTPCPGIKMDLVKFIEILIGEKLYNYQIMMMKTSGRLKLMKETRTRRRSGNSMRSTWGNWNYKEEKKLLIVQQKRILKISGR